ncbi:MAG: serine hydrolase domain-containing protein [Candidatus Saccharimonadales bacterium]
MDNKALERASSYIKGWLRYGYERGDTPGIVVTIAHKDKLVLNEAYGYADLEKKTPMSPSHLFRIASHSKTFTATAIMQLQEQGKLRIDDYVVEYLPWLNQHKDKRWAKVTIRQLLSHSAGVIRDGTSIDYWNVEKPFPSEEQFKQDLLKADLVTDNNTKLKYSNYGYTLLGMLIETVSGKNYSQYVAENIVNPLSLKNTDSEFNPKLKDKFVTGYSRLDNKKQRLPIEPIDTRIMASATGFYSNAEDLCKYFSAHMPRSGKLLDDESKKEMQRSQWEAENSDTKEGYCLGLDYEIIGKRRALGHGGGFPGNITKSYFDPKDGLIVIVLTNANGSWAGYMGMNIIKIIDYFQNNADEPKWQMFAGRYMDLWWDADIVAVGEKLIAASAGSWEPFENPAELEHIRDNTFKITKTDSWSAVDETVEFKMSGDKVEAMIYAGATMLPEPDYLQKVYSKKTIGNT